MRRRSGSVTREDLYEAVQRVARVSQREAIMLVSQVLEEIALCLARGETVKLTSFGLFYVRQKRERIGRNPKTGEPAPIPARRVLMFKPSPNLKQKINSQPPRTSVHATDKSQPEPNP
jgi:integration host factor subunit alpha